MTPRCFIIGKKNDSAYFIDGWKTVDLLIKHILNILILFSS